MAVRVNLGLLRQHIKHNTRIFRVMYAILIIIPFAMALTASVLAARILEEESFKLNRFLLEQAADRIENVLRSNALLAQQLFMEYNVIRINQLDFPFDIDEQYRITMAVEELKSYASLNDYRSSSFFVYYPKLEYILTPEAAYRSDFYFNKVVNFNDFSSSEAAAEFIKDKTHPHDYYLLERRIQNTFQGTCLTFVHHLTSGAKDPILLVSMVDVKSLQTILQGDEDFNLFLYLEEGEKNLSGTSESISLPSYGEFPRNGQIWYTDMDNEGHAFLSLESAYGGIKYISSIPVKVFRRKVILIRNVLFALALGILAVSLYILYISSSRISDFFFDIRERVASESGDVPESKKDVLELVSHAVDEAYRTRGKLEEENKVLLEENEVNRRRIKDNYLMVRNSLIRNVLVNDAGDYTRQREMYERYGVIWDKDRFVAVAVQLEIPWNSRFEEKREQCRNMDLLLHSLVQETGLGEGIEVHLAFMNRGEYVIIFNYDGKRDSWLRETAERVHSFLMNNLIYSVSLGIGTPVSRVIDLPASLEKARDALHYRIVAGHGAVIAYSDIEDEDKEYYYPIERELKLINSVRSGAREECLELLEDLFTRNFEERNSGTAVAQRFFYDLTSTVIKILDSLNIPLDALYPGDDDILARLTSSGTVDEIHDKVSRILEETCQYVNKSKERDDRERADILKEQLENSYRDISFSQSLLAEKMGMSPAYLSGFFKEYFGMNMQEYVQRKRLEEACRLLMDRELHLAEVAEKVGYTSDKTLIRVFKQYLGITPGKYREMNERNRTVPEVNGPGRNE